MAVQTADLSAVGAQRLSAVQNYVQDPANNGFRPAVSPSARAAPPEISLLDTPLRSDAGSATDTVSLSASSFQALRQAGPTTREPNEEITGANSPSPLTDSGLRDRLEEAVDGLDDETAGRVRDQAGLILSASGLRQFAREAMAAGVGPGGNGGQVVAGGEVIPQSPLAGGASPIVSAKLLAYLQLIEKLSGDSERLERFLDAMDESLDNGAGDLGAIAGAYAAEAVTAEASVEEERVIRVSYESLDTEFEIRISRGGYTIQEVQSEMAVAEGDPLVFDMDGDGIEVSSLDDGVEFDIDGDGRKERTAFATGNDAFLALDRNGNGSIDSGKELFGDQHGARNGLEELAKHDRNGDGRIDANDAVFQELRLFTDRNRNGRSERSELLTLEQAGIKSIDLDSTRDVDRRLASGNRLTQIASYTRSDGTTGRAGDVMLKYLA